MTFVDTLDALLKRAARLATPGTRRVLGIAGPPGAGKSTVAEAVVAELAGLAVLVPMDGFHLSNSQLRRLGRRDRKGALDTFDGAGYLCLLRRLVANDEDVVFAPEFRREIEEAVAGAIAVPRSTPLVVTEGNYLLVEEPPWGEVRDLLHEAWYLDVEPATRVERLVSRHVHYGRARDQAEAWVYKNDEVNAREVAATSHRADLIVTGLER